MFYLMFDAMSQLLKPLLNAVHIVTYNNFMTAKAAIQGSKIYIRFQADNKNLFNWFNN